MHVYVVGQQSGLFGDKFIIDWLLLFCWISDHMLLMYMYIKLHANDDDIGIKIYLHKISSNNDTVYTKVTNDTECVCVRVQSYQNTNGHTQNINK